MLAQLTELGGQYGSGQDWRRRTVKSEGAAVQQTNNKCNSNHVQSISRCTSSTAGSKTTSCQFSVIQWTNQQRRLSSITAKQLTRSRGFYRTTKSNNYHDPNKNLHSLNRISSRVATVLSGAHHHHRHPHPTPFERKKICVAHFDLD